MIAFDCISLDTTSPLFAHARGLHPLSNVSFFVERSSWNLCFLESAVDEPNSSFDYWSSTCQLAASAVILHFSILIIAWFAFGTSDTACFSQFPICDLSKLSIPKLLLGKQCVFRNQLLLLYILKSVKFCFNFDPLKVYIFGLVLRFATCQETQADPLCSFNAKKPMFKMQFCKTNAKECMENRFPDNGPPL